MSVTLFRRCYGRRWLYDGRIKLIGVGCLAQTSWRKFEQGTRSAFSTSARLAIMETTGFTETQMTVREAVGQLCAKYPNTYWQEHDQNAEDPTDFRKSYP